jgi:hypothetical protein
VWSWERAVNVVEKRAVNVVEKSKVIKVGPVEAMPGVQLSTRMAILIWGAATVGKTTFAATAPGRKLWLSFGDNEHVSVAHRKDVIVARLDDLSLEELFKHAQNDNPFGLDQILAENEDIETVVCDSLTALTFRALQKAVRNRVGASRKENFVPTIEQPGLSAYGGRNGTVLECLTGLLKVTAKHNVHFIANAHESDEKTKKDPTGNDIIDYVTVQLGGQLVSNMTWRLSEIWYMSQDQHSKEHKRRLAIRPTRLRRPMKTRMFTNKGEPEFVLRYDADLPDKGQHTIADWYSRWVKCGYQKVEIPK